MISNIKSKNLIIVLAIIKIQLVYFDHLIRMYVFVSQCAGKYMVKADLETGGGQELAVKSGDRVQLVKQGDDGQW